MSLLIIIEVIFLNIIFYVDFCFMKEKRHNNYVWVLKTLKRLYDHFNLSYFKTILFNDDKTLTSAFFEMFENTVKHALCIWYININIMINIKKYFFYKRTFWKLHVTLTRFLKRVHFRSTWETISKVLHDIFKDEYANLRIFEVENLISSQKMN